jgi:hypothetical protein
MTDALVTPARPLLYMTTCRFYARVCGSRGQRVLGADGEGDKVRALWRQATATHISYVHAPAHKPHRVEDVALSRKDESQSATVVQTRYDVNPARVGVSAEVRRKKERGEVMLPRMSFWTHNVRPCGARSLGPSAGLASGENLKGTDAETLDQ